jgi:sec-independent protein translocase protein TatC
MAQVRRKNERSDEGEEAQARMSFGEHLEELRKRIIRAMLGSVAGVLLCILNYKEIVAIVSRPYRLVAEKHNLANVFATLKPQESFLTSITLAFQAGLVLSSPWIIYQIWQFVAAGLYKRERRIVYRYTIPSGVLFLIGVGFFYFIVLPMTLNFFMNFSEDPVGGQPVATWLEQHILSLGGKTEPAATQPATQSTQPATQNATEPAAQPGLQPIPLPMLTTDPPPPPAGQWVMYMDADGRIKARTSNRIVVVTATREGAMFATQWRYDDYLSFVMFTALVFGLAFELPLVIVVVAQIGIVEVKTFRSMRKYAYFGMVALAAVAAPGGDVMSLACLTVPLLVLYEVGIIVAAVIVRRQQQASGSGAAS